MIEFTIVVVVAVLISAGLAVHGSLRHEKRSPETAKKRSRPGPAPPFIFDAINTAPVTVWEGVLQAHRERYVHTLLKRQFPQHYPNYHSHVFVLLEYYISREVEDLIGQGKQDVMIAGATALAFFKLAAYVGALPQPSAQQDRP